MADDSTLNQQRRWPFGRPRTVPNQGELFQPVRDRPVPVAAATIRPSSQAPARPVTSPPATALARVATPAVAKTPSVVAPPRRPMGRPGMPPPSAVTQPKPVENQTPPRPSLRSGLAALSRRPVEDTDDDMPMGPDDLSLGASVQDMPPDDGPMPTQPAPRSRLASLNRGPSRDEDEEANLPAETPRQEPAASSDGTVEIEIKIKKLIREFPDTGFRIYLVGIEGGETVSLSTKHPLLVAPNEKLIARGTWKLYKGRRTFDADVLLSDLPRDALGVVKWLKSGAVPGCGEGMGRKLAEHFGSDVQRALGDYEALKTVPGLKEKHARAIADKYNDNMIQTTLVTWLGGLGIGPATITKIVNRYGNQAKMLIEKNPWQLAHHIDGVGFPTADSIGMRQGHSRTSPERIKAGLRYVLKEAVTREGHCGLPIPVLIAKTARLLGLLPPDVKAQVDDVLAGESFSFEPLTGLASPDHIKEAEEQVAAKLLRMNEYPALDPDLLPDLIERAEADMGIKLDPSQRDAVILAVTNNICIITGGPGTGKSTAQKVIAHVLKAVRKDIVLAAPTGRAAKRLAEVSNMDASTCHRLLQSAQGHFKFTADNPFEENWFIVDEFSMVDIKLCHAFFQAIQDGSGLTIVGDVDQLPSVGPGQVLRDLIQSGALPVARLNVVHRQGNDSGIVVAAHNINNGRHPIPPGRQLDGFEIEHQEDPDDIAARIVKLMDEVLPSMGYDPIKDVQVLAPMRKGDIGIDRLNLAIKDTLNPARPDGRSATLKNRTFSVGDRVMHTRNDYVKGVYNGEVGSVIACGTRPGRNGALDPYITVDYSGYEASYSPADIGDVEQSWAATVHKSQGCEFPVVIFACHSSQRHMLNRNLVYTAVTRAKKLCIVVGEEAMLEIAAKTTERDSRYTGLAKLIDAERKRLLENATPETDDVTGFIQVEP